MSHRFGRLPFQCSLWTAIKITTTIPYSIVPHPETAVVDSRALPWIRALFYDMMGRQTVPNRGSLATLKRAPSALMYLGGGFHLLIGRCTKFFYDPVRGFRSYRYLHLVVYSRERW